MVAKEIKQEIVKALKVLKLPEVEFTLEHPENEQFGDYATNVVFQFKVQSEKLKIAVKNSKLAQCRTPRDVAQEIADELKKNLPEFIARVEIAGQGFINFWLSEQSLLEELEQAIHLGDRYGQNETLKGKKIMVEFTDPNPFKEFHIGHLYSNTVGEALARLLETSGATLKRANYQGDVGLHVAKALYGLLAKFKVQSAKFKVVREKIKELEQESLKERVRFLGEAYALGARAYEEDMEAKKEIEELNTKIYERSDPDINTLYDVGRCWSLEYFETIYKRLGTKFDFYYFESEAGKVGLRYVRENLKKGIFAESEGAIIFPGEKHGLHTRVFVNSQGLPTYEAKDLGLASTKYKDFPYDESIIITGNEVDEYFRVVLKALALLNPELGKKTKHLSHGMVRLPTGKMSSRTGEVLTGEWLLDEVKLRITAVMEKSERVSQEELSKIADTIVVGAVKYALLRSAIGRDITFDFEKSVSLEGDSGPYLQYTYARARSVLRNSKLKTQNSKLQFKTQNYAFNAEELAILRWLYRFPEVVRHASEVYAPNLVCGFLYTFAQRFNVFYNKHRILQEPNVEHRVFRLQLTAAVAQVLKNGLDLLGIQAPERM